MAKVMHVHTRSAYRWDGRKIDPDAAGDNEEQLDRLLRQARARNAASSSVDPPSLADYVSASSDFLWHPHSAKGEKIHNRGMPTLPSSVKVRKRAWLTRSVTWLFLLMMAGIACLPFGADVVRIATAVL